jgi:hypothetical protein
MFEFYQEVAKKAKALDIKKNYRKQQNKIISTFALFAFLFIGYTIRHFYSIKNDQVVLDTLCDVISVETHHAHNKEYIVSFIAKPQSYYDDNSEIVVVDPYKYIHDVSQKHVPCKVFYYPKLKKSVVIEKYKYNKEQYFDFLYGPTTFIILMFCVFVLFMVIPFAIYLDEHNYNKLKIQIDAV